MIPTSARREIEVWSRRSGSRTDGNWAPGHLVSAPREALIRNLRKPVDESVPPGRRGCKSGVVQKLRRDAVDVRSLEHEDHFISGEVYPVPLQAESLRVEGGPFSEQLLGLVMCSSGQVSDDYQLRHIVSEAATSPAP